MAVLRNGSKCSHTTCACMLRFFTISRLALNPNLTFEIGSIGCFKTSRLLVSICGGRIGEVLPIRLFEPQNIQHGMSNFEGNF